MKRFMLTILYILIGLIAFAALYFGADALLSRIPSPKSQSLSLPLEIDAYVLSNGVHTDIVLPIKDDLQDWTTVFPIENTKGRNSDQRYISIGWGDKGFYLNTPEWKDLTLKTALIAGFGIGETALHITYYKQMVENELCYKITIDRSQYKALRDYILAALDTDSDGKPILIQTNAQYGQDDAFYEAKGAYNLFFSCNTWTNKALKKANMPSGIWTVFDKGILRHFRE
ncbi:TIGR02117 family protein [Sphingobacterium sp. BN32]|uniref:TIGR02117 family protein n=1 Tax=Sphingobacterium sp. BN32 TaxID=3058432 RepID=UPI00265C93F9|nr:TIGR02117 family protein [Sphingobacterium sp. BN32]WKK58119.1 TIGR02117 family protein [Sphingobacterium sp. BN32]